MGKSIAALNLSTHAPCLPNDPLRCATYQLALLTFLEELQQGVDVRNYDLSSTKLKPTPGGRLLALDVRNPCTNKQRWERGGLFGVCRGVLMGP
jgi:hypothetical protein